MAEELASVRKPALAERRAAAVAAKAHPVAAAARPMSVARTLQQRLGNRGTQVVAAQVVARSSAPGIAPNSGAGMGQLSLSQPGDAHEREADRMADIVMRMPAPASTPSTSPRLTSASAGGVIQRLCADCEEVSKELKVHKKEAANDAPQVTAPVAASISALRGGGGSPLPASARAFFEPRFGADFSRVRVHTDTHAARTASSINAKAFTAGRDIAFAPGQFAPHSGEGQRLLAHELTHVVQQSGTQADSSGGTIMRAGFPGIGLPAGSPGPKYPTAPKPSPSEAAVRAAAEEVVELKGHTTFDPSPALAEMINYLSPQVALSVRVRFGKLAYGRIDIKLRGGYFMSTEDPAMIDLKHPAFPGSGYLAPPRLVISVVNNLVTGRVQFFPWDRLPGSLAGAWLKANPLQKLLGWKGVDRIHPALAVNEISGGVLRYRLEKFTYRLDGEWEGLGNFDVTDEKVQFAAETNVKVPGVVDSKMPLEWTAGTVFGTATNFSLTLAPKDILGGKFSGSLEGSFAGGVTNIAGEATYTSEKVNGTVTIRVAPVQEAWAQLATHQLPGAAKITPVAAGPDTTHAVFGWGVLDFHFNDWLSGRASVIVDPQGFITTYGYIRPTKEWSFLEGDEYGVRKLLGKAGPASAFYPVWFTTGVTGTISGELWAAGRIGPLTIHDLELSGVYSTNPTVPFNLSLSGVIDVSAIGRVELILSGSLSYTLVGKHVKTVTITVDVTGIGTLKAYGLLKPTFSIEKAKDGDTEFRIKTTLKLAAGLYLGLEGSIKVSLPIVGGPKFKSKKYQWFVKGIGLKSELDYLLGDPKGPDLAFEPYAFDPKEFHDKAEDLLDNAAEKYDKKKQETEAPLEDQTTRAPQAALPPPKVILFTMNRAPHKLWIEAAPQPEIIMETKRGPLKEKLQSESTLLKKEESTAEGSQQALIRAEENAVAALNKRATDVETSAASLEQRQADVAGLQELARQIELYSKQFTKQDIGDRTSDMQTGKKDLEPQEGLVGTYGQLSKIGSAGDALTPHHMPADSYMEAKLKGNPGGEKWVYEEGICINLYQPDKKGAKSRTGRHHFTRSYRRKPNLAEKPMEALQKDIANVRAIYEKEGLLKGRVENGLALAHALNVKNYPKLFRGS